MAKRKDPSKKPIEQYDHKGKKRVNNPPNSASELAPAFKTIK